MAARTWDGNTDTDWATATNWTADTLPAADDEVAFDSRQVTKPTTGMSDGAANNSGHASQCTFDLLHFRAGYTGGIGTAALPLICAPDTIIIDGTGTYHICVGGTDQSTEKVIPNIYINNSSAIVYLYSNCNDADHVSTFTDVYISGGTVYLAFYEADTDDHGVNVTNLYLVPRNGSDSAVTVIIEKDAYDVDNAGSTNIYMGGGTLSTDSQVGIFHMWGGTVYYGSEPNLGTTVTEADMDIANLIMHDGIFYWEPDDSGNPTITTAYLFGGTFDASGKISNDKDKIITTTYLHKGVTMNLNNQRSNITMTNLYRFGGTLITDEWTKIALAYYQP